MNNSSLLTADRMTHLKIVVISLVFATLVAGIGITARVTDGKMIGIGRSLEVAGPVIKAPAPITASTGNKTTVR